MSKRYTYSRSINTVEGVETFTADQFDSFDEALRAVERGISDRKHQLKEKGSIKVSDLEDSGLIIPPTPPSTYPNSTAGQVLQPTTSVPPTGK
jgi:hypothetical protein